jgi:hypothetical protein
MLSSSAHKPWAKHSRRQWPSFALIRILCPRSWHATLSCMSALCMRPNKSPLLGSHSRQRVFLAHQPLHMHHAALHVAADTAAPALKSRPLAESARRGLVHGRQCECSTAGQGVVPRATPSCSIDSSPDLCDSVAASCRVSRSTFVCLCVVHFCTPAHLRNRMLCQHSHPEWWTVSEALVTHSHSCPFGYMQLLLRQRRPLEPTNE